MSMMPGMSTVLRALRAAYGLAMALVCTISLWACSDSGVGEGGTGTFASGPITGFGSLFVAGVKFDQQDAVLDAEDEDASPTFAQLQPGMVVAVDAGAVQVQPDGRRSANAQRIRLIGSSLGPVTDVSLLGRSLRVLGTRVRFNSATIIDESIRERLRLGQSLAGQVVEVWGYADPRLPGFVATFMQLRTDSPAIYKARGLVRSVSGTEVVIGEQRFDFSGLGALPQAGDLVRVGVDATAGAQPWPVRRWSRLTESVSGEGIRVDIEGIVTAVTDARRFRVNGVPVQLSADTADLAVGGYVSVTGVWRAGALQADSLQIEDEARQESREFRWEGSVSSLDATGGRLIVTTDTGRSATVTYDSSTSFNNGTVAQLSNGAVVEVRGRFADGTLSALSITFR